MRYAIQEEVLGDILSVNSQFKLELLRNGTHFMDTLYWILDEDAVRTSGYLTGEAAFDEGTPTVATQDGGRGGYVVFDDWDGWPTSCKQTATSIVSLLDGNGENVCVGYEAVHVQEVFVSQYTDSTMTLPLDEALWDLSIPHPGDAPAHWCGRDDRVVIPPAVTSPGCPDRARPGDNGITHR